ncbi:sugar phosphate permease [Ereboglobus sp. PH5-5]|uniref:MFS transporter n=1 Tax=unclassified Ereboglobus TaxID=2626932 RepID=UPI0024070E20|nr:MULTISPECIES: MFS transporter [unclassified Ereboglobus]MDF9827193.1 sugar phosphate permease [Ereboglobus sp. PH5-10]MDF9832613.1 sugar phosphate permease [Ereboglobus sp. PH5-5]
MEKQKTTKSFHYWQWRTIIATMVGYSLFYFIRKNLSVAMPGLQAEFGITKAQLGIFLTAHGLIYGVSKFVNGIIGDRVNARAFMVFGLLAVSLCGLAFASGPTIAAFFAGSNTGEKFTAILVVTLGVIWMLNGFFQGTGFPPCARLITHWVPPSELAFKMSIWNASHSIGAGFVVVLCGYLVMLGWRWCFWVPSMITIVGAGLLWLTLRDTPSSVGLPELPGTEKKSETTDTEADRAEFKKFLRKKVFLNPIVWLCGFANFFIYTIRYAILDWGPTMLGEWKHISITKSTWMVAGFEIAAIAGMLVAGWATDRFFKGRAARVCVLCMAFVTVILVIFWLVPLPTLALVPVLMAAGFFIYGPQALTGVITANIVTRRGAATAIGFTSLFSYASTVLSGWGLGLVAQNYGWAPAIGVLCGAGVIGLIAFLCLWNTKRDAYEEESAEKQ